MIFKNREQAAYLLSKKLQNYKNQNDVIVLGIACDGAVLAYHIAKDLGVCFNFLISRSLQSIKSPKVSIGAVSEKGHLYLQRPLMFSLKIPDCYLKQEVLKQKNEISKKKKKFRKFIPFPDVAGKIVILVDEGIEDSSTLFAELEFLKQQNVKKLVVATPVSATAAFQRVQQIADDVICLEVEDSFSSISQFYCDFSPIEDAEFMSLLKAYILFSSY